MYTCFSLVYALIIFHRSEFEFIQSHQLRNFMFYLRVKETRYVPQFKVISYEKVHVFLIYLHLNLLIPTSSGSKIMLFLK